MRSRWRGGPLIESPHAAPDPDRRHRMRWFNSLLGLALFAFVFWFAVRNSGSVPISLWGDLRWEAVPLVLVIVGCGWRSARRPVRGPCCRT